MLQSDGNAGASARLISVVLPVHNEAENIQPALRGIWAALKDHPHEILVCYDFDADTTLPAIRAMPDCPPTVRLVKNEERRGVVRALQAGFRAARGDVVVTTMADLSDPPEVIPALAARIRSGASVVSGSRYMKGGSQTGGPFLKRTLSRCAGWSLHWLAGLGTRDATTNFRAYSADFLRHVKVESTRGFEIGLELTVKAHCMGLKVDEVPSTWRDRTAGESRFRLWSWLPAYLHWYMKALWKPMAWAGAGILSLIWLLALSSTPEQSTVTAELDSSWGWTLHETFARQTPATSNLAFTYGPWGFTFVPICHPGTFLISTLVMAIWGCALFWGVWRIACGSFSHPLWAFIWMLCLFRLGSATRDNLALLTFMSLTIAYFHFEKTARQGALLAGTVGALASLALLAKFSVGIGGLVCVAMIAIDLGGRRRCPWSLLTFAAALPLLWLAAGQDISAMGAFFRHSWEIASGYTEAMSLRGHAPELAWYCAAAGLLLAIVIAAELRLRRWRGFLPAAVIALTLFLAFKHGFVRHDLGHVWYAMVSLISWVILLAPFAWIHLRPRWPKWLVIAVCILAVFSCANWPGFPQVMRVRGSGILAFLGDAPRIVAGSCARFVRIVLHPDDVARVHAAGMAQLRTEWPLPPMTGTVDMYPPNQTLIFANELTYLPRPVFQSYTAYTPELEEINRRHVAGPDCPDNILFGIAPIDTRFPPLEDGLSWPELLTRYEPAGDGHPFLLLKKRQVPLHYAFEPLAQYQVPWDEMVKLQAPTDEPVWAEIDVRPSLMGRLELLLYKPDHLMMGLEAKDGHKSIYHFVPGMARCGFLLSPVILNRGQFNLLYTRAGMRLLESHAVTALKLIGFEHRHPQGYEDHFTVRLYRLKYARR